MREHKERDKRIRDDEKRKKSLEEILKKPFNALSEKERKVLKNFLNSEESRGST